MDLFIGIPLFTRAGNEELEARHKAVMNWVEQNRIAIKDRYKFSEISTLPLHPGQELKLQIDTENIITIKYPNVVTKGLAIRLHILAVLDFIDHKETSRRDDSYYLMIDGSGAFDYSNIFLVLDKLCGIPRYDVVFGKRPPGNCGMAIWRKNVELFEEYLIYEKFGRDNLQNITGQKELPDSQAGCWGLRLGVMKHVPLTARNYELEYDLLISAIESKVHIGFTDPLIMAPRNATDFGKEVDSSSIKQCITKMDFIVHRLGLEKADILKLFNKYHAEISHHENRMLPEAYIEELANFVPFSDL